jgi:hypothetical protein
MRAAAGLIESTMPRSSMVMMPSTAVSKTTCRRSSVSRATLRSVAALALDHVRQAGEGILGNEIVRAGAHHLQGDLVIHLAGDEDAGEVGVFLLDDLQGGERVELRQHVVEENHIPLLAVESLPQGGVGIHPRRCYGPSRVTQHAQDEQGVVLRVLHQEDPERQCSRCGWLRFRRHRDLIPRPVYPL